MLLCQVLNLEFLLVHCAFILETSLLLPLRVEKGAVDRVRAIFLFEAIKDSQKALVLSVAKLIQIWLISSIFFSHANRHALNLPDFLECFGS